MNGRLLLAIAAVGILMGAASVAGVVRTGVEGLVWVALIVPCAVAVGIYAPRRPFLHGFLGGLLAGIIAPLVQVAFFDRYLAMNPQAVASFQLLPPSVSPRLAVLIAAPFVAACYGLVLGLLAWIVAKVRGRGRDVPAIT